MDSAACSRSSVRQRPNGTPASAANARASVRSLAPTSRPHSRSVRRSAGSARSASATRRAVTASGSRTPIVVTGTGVSRSASSASACARRLASRPGWPRYPMSSASSGLAATGVGWPVSAQLTPEQPGPDVQRAHGGAAAVGGGLVRQPGRDPQRPGRRQHPGRLGGQHGEHPARRPGQLVVLVGVPVEAGARGHGEVRHEDGCALVFAAVRSLSGSRHNMAAYALPPGAPRGLASVS